jgi:hypothetical protein
MRQLFYILLLIPFLGNAQHLARKHYDIQRTNTPPLIDGKANDAVWNTLPSGSQFVSMEPTNGLLIKEVFQTTFKATYDNEALYVLVLMNDPAPDSILTQLSKRDGIESANTDQIGLWINPYNDGQTDFNFSVSAAGVQADAKYSADDVDPNWDMVWDSEVSITENGWIAEYKIPYSALRFPQTEVQTWGLNVARLIRRSREWYTWSYLDMSKENLSAQTGQLAGFKNIEPPLRLSLMPYIASYLNHYEGAYSSDINGGLDLKYGINESFTLDMTLIPDFGQVDFDNHVLNLSPFEVQYDEKRAFFTEGTELLEKGGLFYSRRISDNLINASKVTGRNSKNLGIGILNAITNTEDEGYSNYNVFALDQSIRGNSYITFTNTNVLQINKDASEANVSGLSFSLQDKQSHYQLKGKFNLSQVAELSETERGFASMLAFSRIAGKFRFDLYQNIESDSYNPNHLGFLYNNNEFSHGGSISYRSIQASKHFVNYRSSLSIHHEQLYAPRVFSELEIDYELIATLKNYLTCGIFGDFLPMESDDYFESRDINNAFKRSEKYGGRMFISSDYRKVFALDASIHHSIEPLYEGHTFGYRLSPRIRFNDKLFASYVFSTSKNTNNAGYSRGVFAIRDVTFFTNVLQAQYVVNNKMSFNIKFRHHWEQVKNHSYHELDKNGYLSPSIELEDKHDMNFNAWNIDLSYSWWFAPGSELSIVWKNAILTNGEALETHYRDNLSALMNNPQENSLSLKMRYYLDYQYLKKAVKRTN